MPNAIIVGASSGIGRALAKELSREYDLGLAARRTDRLRAVGEDIGGAHVAEIDVTQPDARERFDDLVDSLGGVDLVVVSSGIGRHNPDLGWEPERDTVDVNVRGFTAIATAAMEHFEATDGGHLVGISSVAGEIGSPTLPAYSASKAYVSRYLEGLRYRAGDEITVTDVRPGFVDTPMSPETERFWECSPETAAGQIARAISKEKSVAYVTRRWWLVSKVLGLLPDRYRAGVM
ncbi:SDR family NAD(P)-dependent oxidoreductase [Natronomonas gomsonensis]|jgi:short-subunit dehydrogenase|uniref:SDR family NAD(P)-dependent oxidoreductase n=1 Tax=Natronomonas gomsonensis TaxID=1046043 RepID=UPI0020CA6DB0|nr:SDR family NAD(P)-dependent oxidoreductase [Natronomonas gomsonensis]MCY4729630.1 SDR family NAD(P)-dependent oxidoreductase [Natronomonas gomsonensis]